MNNHNKTWTLEEIEFMKEFYPKYGSVFCSEKLQRKKRPTVAKAKRLGLKSLRIKFRYSKENFEPIVKNSKNYQDILRALGLRAAGGSYVTIKNYIKKYKISIKHFDDQKELKTKRLRQFSKLIQIPLSKILIQNSTYNRSHLKARLYKEGLKKRLCELCGQGEYWMGKKMSLILDHENGINNDNRMKNLRIICPNCNATLETHCGKNTHNAIERRKNIQLIKQHYELHRRKNNQQRYKT